MAMWFGGLLSKLPWFSSHKIVVTLEVHPRAGGYMMVKSPDLPGFSLMLHPQEASDPAKVMSAILEPLSEFIVAEWKASEKASKKARTQVQVTGVHRSKSDSKTYLADVLCHA